jgi:hypothetical protein
MDKRVVTFVAERLKKKKVKETLIEVTDGEVFYNGEFVDVIDFIPEEKVAETKPDFDTPEEAIEYYARTGDGKAMKAYVDLSKDKQRKITYEKFLNGEL